MCAIVRRIVRPFMSWSDTTPAPTVAGTPSYLAPVRRAEPNATSAEMPLWFHGCGPSTGTLLSAEAHVWTSKPRGQRYVEVFKSAGIGAEKTQSDHRYRLVSLSRNFGHQDCDQRRHGLRSRRDYLIHIKSEGSRPLAYARNLLATRDCCPLGFDSYFAAANLIYIKSYGQIFGSDGQIFGSDGQIFGP
jgi:hypothetical protein